MATVLHHKDKSKKAAARAIKGYRYLLLHNCMKEGCEGAVGSEVILSQEHHEWFQEHVVPARGAKLLSIVYADGESEVEYATDEPIAELR